VKVSEHLIAEKCDLLSWLHHVVYAHLLANGNCFGISLQCWFYTTKWKECELDLVCFWFHLGVDEESQPITINFLNPLCGNIIRTKQPRDDLSFDQNGLNKSSDDDCMVLEGLKHFIVFWP
jgi:hypothetical protein